MERVGTAEVQIFHLAAPSKQAMDGGAIAIARMEELLFLRVM
jgi:hypothetical protein